MREQIHPHHVTGSDARCHQLGQEVATTAAQVEHPEPFGVRPPPQHGGQSVSAFGVDAPVRGPLVGPAGVVVLGVDRPDPLDLAHVLLDLPVPAPVPEGRGQLGGA